MSCDPSPSIPPKKINPVDDRDEEQLRALDSTVQTCTTQLITIATTKSDDGRSLSSLIFIITSIGDTHKEVAKILVRYRDAIYNSPQLRSLLKDYYKCIHDTLDFLNLIELWLSGANGVKVKLDRVKSAVRDFKSKKSKTYHEAERRLLQKELAGFGDASDPVITQKLYAKLDVVLKGQARLHESLLEMKNNNEIQEAQLKLYRKVSTVILASVYVGLLACAVTAAVLSPGLVVPALAAFAVVANLNPTQHLEKWMDQMWNKYQTRLAKRNELVNALMEAASKTQITVADLERIKEVVQGLQERFRNVPANPKDALALWNNPVVKAMVDDLERKVDQFSKVIQDLKDKKKQCETDVMDAKAKLSGTTMGKKKKYFS